MWPTVIVTALRRVLDFCDPERPTCFLRATGISGPRPRESPIATGGPEPDPDSPKLHASHPPSPAGTALGERARQRIVATSSAMRRVASKPGFSAGGETPRQINSNRSDVLHRYSSTSPPRPFFHHPTCTRASGKTSCESTRALSTRRTTCAVLWLDPSQNVEETTAGHLAECTSDPDRCQMSARAGHARTTGSNNCMPRLTGRTARRPEQAEHAHKRGSGPEHLTPTHGGAHAWVRSHSQRRIDPMAKVFDCFTFFNELERSSSD